MNRLWPPYYLWTYRQWQKDAYKLGKRLHETIRFDLVHQLTYVGFRVPGYLWKLDAPFVWGPVGGLQNTPWKFLPAMGPRGAIHHAGRNLINSYQRRFLGLPRRAFEKANGGIVAATNGVKRDIARYYGKDSRVICEIGVPERGRHNYAVRKPSEPLRIAWSGRHLPGKALPLLLMALAKLPARIEWRLDILGDGPCREKWMRRAIKLGIQNGCTWHGRVSRDVALSIMAQAHVFVITSLHDLTSTVLLEALSLGVPVICPDLFGFSDVITQECGIKTIVGCPRGIREGITRALQEIWAQEPYRQRLARGARERSLQFTWQKKMAAISKLYENTVDNSSVRHLAEKGPHNERS
jgi:glycosyltransferase involved in cell wall biosynthesis